MESLGHVKSCILYGLDSSTRRRCLIPGHDSRQHVVKRGHIRGTSQNSDQPQRGPTLNFTFFVSLSILGSEPFPFKGTSKSCDRFHMEPPSRFINFGLGKSSEPCWFEAVWSEFRVGLVWLSVILVWGGLSGFGCGFRWVWGQTTLGSFFRVILCRFGVSYSVRPLACILFFPLNPCTCIAVNQASHPLKAKRTMAGYPPEK